MLIKKATIVLMLLAVIGLVACSDAEETGPGGPAAEPDSEIQVAKPGTETSVPETEAAGPQPEADVIETTLGLIETPNARGLSVGSSVGKLAPNFRLETDNGQSIALSDLRGSPVLLNFFAVWCGPCRYEMPTIQEVHERLGDELAVLAVDIDEPRERIAAYREVLGLGFPMLLDDGASVSAAYEVRVLPSTYLIDGEGVIRAVRLGAFASAEQILGALKEAGL